MESVTIIIPKKKTELTVSPVVPGLPASSLKLNTHQVSTSNDTAILLHSEDLGETLTVQFSIFLQMSAATITGSGLIQGHCHNNSLDITSNNYFESVMDSLNTLPGENDEPPIIHNYSYKRKGTQDRDSPIEVVLEGNKLKFYLYGDPNVVQDWAINRLDIY